MNGKWLIEKNSTTIVMTMGRNPVVKLGAGKGRASKYPKDDIGRTNVKRFVGHIFPSKEV